MCNLIYVEYLLHRIPDWGVLCGKKTRYWLFYKEQEERYTKKKEPCGTVGRNVRTNVIIENLIKWALSF
jgi:hypothetical protein